ncbi:MAG: LPS export ABC transporter permease LptF, partial [Gammaproteobacteria bacterium]|nr:LPS export ABC transporter permease LptF [Gammaproteobacteria bacterium]
ASNRLPKEAVLQVMLLASLQYLTIILPVGLFLSILLAMGRLYRDSEMYALMACGVGPARLYRPILAFALMLAALATWLSLEAAPWAVREVQRIAQEARERSDLRAMEPGRFVTFGHAEAVVYAEALSGDGHLRNVFVQRRVDASVEVIVAEEAWQRETDDPNVKMLTFRSGRRYEGEPGGHEFKVIEFAEHGIPFSLPDQGPLQFDPEARPLGELFGSADPEEVAELQWRLSVPLMAIVLAVLAVPMARASPRQGRYAGMGAGVLVYVTYANLLGAARVWVERGAVPSLPGMWWVHVVFLLAALALLALRFGSIRQPWRRRAAVAVS